MPTTALPGLMFHNGTGLLNFNTGALASTLALGPVMYSQAEIDSWATGTEYTALTATYIGNTWTPTDFGTAGLTNTTTWQTFHEHGIRCFGKAVMWAVTGTAEWLTDVQQSLDGIKDLVIADIENTNSSRLQASLEMSWAICNYTRAAAIVGRANYDSVGFDAFLTSCLSTILDAYGEANILMTCAAARLMVASYVENVTEFNDAVDYFDYHLKRCVYHSDYDGANIVPLEAVGARTWTSYLWDTATSKVGAGHHESETEQHWYAMVALGGGVYPATYSATSFADGTIADAGRDLSHQAMTATAIAYCCLTIERAGGSLTTEQSVRSYAALAWAAERVFGWINAGGDDSYPTVHPPLTGNYTGNFTDGAVNYLHGWSAIARWCGSHPSGVPANVTSLLGNASVQAISPGLNHQGLDRYADGTLL